MDVIRIESKENAFIKELKKLKEKKYRKQKNQFIVEGIRSVNEVLNSSYEIEYLLYSDKFEDKIDALLKNEKIKNVQFYNVTNDVLKLLCSTETPQGVVAIVNIKKFNIVDELNGFYVLVDKVQDPGNIGAIIRSAHASGAKGVILTKGTVDVFNDKAFRSTMGSVFHIPIIEDDGVFIKKLKNNKFKFVVSSLQTDKNFFDVNLKDNLVICVGNEGNGISKEIYDLADIKVKIPMPGGAESLNVAVASTVMMFEIVRQNMI
ncbi:TrmH family RNA methyltransferase [Clostridium frigidicarnis]|uniref:RNA methyltransferase, TrmH family n=1 Tax=Clostridium frigidicarnis TaxID=84698 RepID=A0A1I0WK22_9CLOT|nr:RNA methyltransferase [Clostridium frigidicarnis]SFA88981.1 RNA methyltransferase, TrmH family [Clostridium frigidicarnis]